MKKYRFLILLILVVFSGCVIEADIFEEQNVFFVDRVIDGDTIELTNGTRIRYIGIDTRR